MALKLARNVGQRIFIGDNIVILVELIRGQQVHLSIDAPRDVIVNREEIAELIKRGGVNPTKS